MRPIRLVMMAFGPYAGREVIDFRSLGGRNFFLVTGPTGGGKTTILDAICYALYGETSGQSAERRRSERTGEQMCSELAAPGHATSVTFDFALGEKKYRVMRSPQQERPRKRGDGTAKTAAQAVLWDRTDAADEEEGTPIATQSSRVTEHVERLLGFRSEQFRQVVVLPQGQFRELLTAGSEQREAILQTLFQTSRFERIQEALKERAKEIDRKSESLREQKTMMLQQAGAKNLDDLTEQRAAKQKIVDALGMQIELLRQGESQAQKRLNEGMQVQAKIDERQAAGKAMKELEAQRPAVERDRKALDAARRAEALAADDALLAQRRREAKAREEEQSAAGARLASAGRARDESRRRLEAEEKRLPEGAKLRQRIAQCDGLAAQVERIEEAGKNLAAARQKVEDVERRREKVQREQDGLSAQMDEENRKLLGARQTAAGHEGNVLAAEQAQKQLKDRRELDEMHRQVAELERRQKSCAKGLRVCADELSRGKTELDGLRRAWSSAQAAILAAGLVAGAACPVCGSTEHPRPARAKGELPSGEEIDRRQREIEKREKTLAELRDELHAVEQKLAAARERESSLRAALGDLAGEAIAALEARVELRRKTAELSSAAGRGISELDAGIKRIGEKLAALKGELQGLEAERQASADEVTRLGAISTELLRGVPEALRTRAGLERARKEGVERLGQIEKDAESARNSAQEAEKALAAAQSAHEKAGAEHRCAQEALTRYCGEFDEKRNRAGFASDEEFRSARLSDVQMRGIEERIGRFDRALSAAGDRLQRASAAAEGLAAPDVAGLQSELAGAKEKLESAIRQRAQRQGEIEQIDRWSEKLKEMAEMQKEMDRDFAVIGRVAEVAGGKNPEGLTFQRFVLTFLLDDVLIAATERLRIMSKGRYQLHRRRERIDRRSPGGLDLEVFDAQCGTSRPVATLSGGESFLASLSLALGLADVVQAYAGGIRLETMFIDEGFGSLDSEALDLAVRSLIDLLKGGRLVGIVSHVPELRELIDARLEVTSGRGGSSTRFVLP